MNSDVTSRHDELESEVAELTDEFLNRLERGENPDVEAFAARHPRHAGVLRNVLPALCLMRRGDSTAGSAADPRKTPPIDGFLGDYRIVGEIGRGGMGVVYEAEQVSLRRRVALKVLPFAAALDAQRLDRFKNEAMAAARLHHGNIVPVYAVGCERGVYYYAMQLIEGHSLADVIQQLRATNELPRDALSGARPADSRAGSLSWSVGRTRGWKEQGPEPGELPDHSPAPDAASPQEAAETRSRLPSAVSTEHSLQTSSFVRTAVELGIQAADALEHAHGMDIVHRDVKPANLLIDGRGHLWMTDFGLARFVSDAGVTMTGDLLGTLRYMSPEQALGKKGAVDYRSDIYSLGATMYELLTLEPVFAGESREELLRRIAFDEPQAPRRRNRSIPHDLETILLKSLAKEPSGRYSTAREMADDLRRFLDNRPILAKRASIVERLSKWARRHRTLVGAAAAVLLVALCGLVVSNVLIAREKSKVQAANRLIAQKNRELAKRQDTLQAALQTETELRSKAEESFRKAREIVEFLSEVSEEELGDKPQLQSRLLQATLDYYQEFIERSIDNPELQADLAKSQLRIARLLHEIGSTAIANVALERAIQTQERLVQQYPTDANYRSTLFGMYFRQGLYRGHDRLFLIAQPNVQEHLGLTEIQVAQLLDIAQRPREGRGPPDFDEIVSMRRQFLEKADAAQGSLESILTPAQGARLSQLSLQNRHIHAFADPEVVSQLGLTPDQRGEIRDLQEEAARQWDALVTRDWGNRDAEEREKTIRSLREFDQKIINDVLTAEQRARWAELIGEPFHFRRGRPRPPRSGPTEPGSRKATAPPA